MSQNKKMLFLLCFFALHYIFHLKFTHFYSKPPLETPVTLGAPQKITKEIFIPANQNYDLTFQFMKHGHNFEELDKIIGSSVYNKNYDLIPSGIAIPVHWSLYSKEANKLVASGEKNTCCGSSYTREEIGRAIDKFSVPSGNYIFELEVLKPIPEFTNIHTNIKISYRPKDDSEWPSSYMWWGMLFNTLIALPLSIYCIAKLLIYTFMRLTSRSRTRHK